MIAISIANSGVTDAFNRLIAFGESPQGALEAIGEKVVAFTEERFDLSVDPYGNPWAPNSDATLRAALERMGGFKQNGKLKIKGVRYLAGKKPLIGESKSLSTQFSYRVLGDSSVTISSPMIYAAMQNCGGTKAEFPSLWGDIPARPFFPNAEQGLPDELNLAITNVLRDALQNAVNG